MGIAPVAYTLWQRFLRFDPGRPDLAQPGPVRAVRGPRLDAAVVAAPPEPASRPSTPTTRCSEPGRGHHGRPEDVPPARLALPRAIPSTAGPAAWRRRPGRWARGGDLGRAWPSPGQWLAARYNRDEFDAVRLQRVRPGRRRLHDGGHLRRRPRRLAGHLELSNLCWIYDSNRVTIEGHTDIAFTEDVAARFMAYGWNVTTVADANDLDSVGPRAALLPGRARAAHADRWCTATSATARRSRTRPRPTASRSASTGPGHQAVPRPARGRGLLRPRRSLRLVRRRASARAAGQAREAWEAMFERYRAAYPDLADEIERMQRRDLPDGWENAPARPSAPTPKGLATRDSSGQVLNAVAQAVPWLSAVRPTCPPSTKTNLDVRRRRRLPGRRPTGPEPALRHSRARGGSDLQRHGPDQAAPVLVELPDLLRLRPRGDPALGADGDPGPAHLHSRLDRCRRGRAHPPAGRAAGLAAGHTGPTGVPPRRRQRGRRDLAHRDRRCGTSPPP